MKYTADLEERMKKKRNHEIEISNKNFSNAQDQFHQSKMMQSHFGDEKSLMSKTDASGFWSPGKAMRSTMGAIDHGQL